MEKLPTTARRGEVSGARDDAKGNAYESRGKWYARISLGKGQRKSIALPHCTLCAPCGAARDAKRDVPVCTVPECANARAQLIATLVRELREAGQGAHIEETYKRIANATDAATLTKIANFVREICGGEWTVVPSLGAAATFKEIREELTSGKLHERFPDDVDAVGAEHARDIKRKAEKYIEPVLGAFPVTAITVDHADEVKRRLPADLSASTRRTIAWVVHRVMGLAHYPLKLIPANPIPAKFMPRPGKARARGFLFPDEEARLLRGVDVPLWRRVLFGFLAREGMRKDEAALLQWGDKRTADAGGWIDLDRGRVYLDEHKTVEHSGARDWPLAPDVIEALKRWRKTQPKGARYVFGPASSAPMNTDHLADHLRDDLASVGVKRAELHTSTSKRRNIVVHDLRGVFVTVAMAQGKSEAWISRRTGHTTSAMLARYRRDAENLAEGTEAALVPMHETIPELAALGGAATLRAVRGGGCGGSAGAASSLAAITSAQSSDADPGFSSVGVPTFLSVEDMGIEPTASRVRF